MRDAIAAAAPALAAAVLVAVALTAVLLASVGSRRDAPHARDLTFTKTDAATHVRATLRAAPRTWGTQLHLWLSGPLYTFSLDRHAGEASGNRFSDQFGGTRFTWLAATPTGTAAAGGGAGTTPASTAPNYPNY